MPQPELRAAPTRKRLAGDVLARRNSRALALGLLAVLPCSGCPERSTPSHPADRIGRLNALVIVIDTLRADHLGSYGYARNTTPNLDALARRSTRYASAYSHAPWTTPSMAALFSSRYPGSLGITNIQSRLPEDLVLLPELLREHGYATAAFVSHSFVSAKWGFAQGFDTFDESNVQGHFATTSERLSDLAIEWLDGAPRSRPFLLFIHYFDPHFAYVGHAAFPFGRGETGYAGPIHSGQLPERFQDDPGALDEADIEELERLYDSEVAMTDREIGRVLDHLESAGLFDSTVIVVAGDHGEEFLDHGALDHTKTLYNELVRVPLLIRIPGVPPAVVEEPVGLIDVYPTIADALSIEPPAGLRGESLLAPIAGRARPIFLETSRIRRLRGVIFDGHKLIVDLDTGDRQLFDLAKDPEERVDASLDDPHQLAILMRLLETWSADREAAELPPELELTDEERERLKALGYL